MFVLQPRVSHVVLSQSFVDGQQAGDLLDDDFSSQFDWTVAVVRPLSLRLKAAGFLTDRERQTDSEPRGHNRAPPD